MFRATILALCCAFGFAAAQSDSIQSNTPKQNDTSRIISSMILQKQQDDTSQYAKFQELIEARKAIQDQFNALAEWHQTLGIFDVAAGIAAIVFGSFTKVQGLPAPLMIGGSILTLEGIWQFDVGLACRKPKG